MPEDWSREQVENAVAVYFDKAAHNRQLQAVTGRKRGSIEFKHRNISAVLIEFGFPYIDGYKPLFNYQRSLLPQIVEERLTNSTRLNEVAETA